MPTYLINFFTSQYNLTTIQKSKGDLLKQTKTTKLRKNQYNIQILWFGIKAIVFCISFL